MIFKYLKKQKEIKQKKKLTAIMIMNLKIPEKQKNLYIKAIDILNNKEMDLLYIELIKFIENIELKEVEDINKYNFSTVAGMRRKEAKQKQKDLNSFSFLINNL